MVWFLVFAWKLCLVSMGLWLIFFFGCFFGYWLVFGFCLDLCLVSMVVVDFFFWLVFWLLVGFWFLLRFMFGFYGCG